MVGFFVNDNRRLLLPIVKDTMKGHDDSIKAVQSAFDSLPTAVPNLNSLYRLVFGLI